MSVKYHDQQIAGTPELATVVEANNGKPVTSGAVKSALDTFVRPNLLDNWYFVGGGSQQGGGQFPINQRGLTSYVYNYLGGYTVDRWKCQTGGTVTVANDGIVINGYSQYGNYANIFQTYENSLSGKKVTASVLINGTELITGTATLSSTNAHFSSADGKTLLMVNASYFSIRHDGGDGDTVTVNAAKLEFGDTQTLAHQENGVWVLNEIPNYEEQLIRCKSSTADSSDTYANDPVAFKSAIADTGWQTISSYVKYRKIGAVVYVEIFDGSYTPSTVSWVNIGELPVGCRPSSKIALCIDYETDWWANISVYTDGTVRVLSNFATLGQVSFCV